MTEIKIYRTKNTNPNTGYNPSARGGQVAHKMLNPACGRQAKIVNFNFGFIKKLNHYI